MAARLLGELSIASLLGLVRRNVRRRQDVLRIRKTRRTIPRFPGAGCTGSFRSVARVIPIPMLPTVLGRRGQAFTTARTTGRAWRCGSQGCTPPIPWPT